MLIKGFQRDAYKRNDRAGGLSRQARKTIQAIKTEESVPTKSVHTLLDGLGFTMRQTGTHQVFRHPKGYRFSLVYRNKDDGVWGYVLKDLRTLIAEIEAKEGAFETPVTTVTERKEELKPMGYQFEKVKEKPSSQDVASYYDEKTLQEKSLPNLTKLDLTKLNEKNAMRALSDSHNEMMAFLKRMGSMVQSVQDYLIELSVKVDDLKAQGAIAPGKAEKQKLSKEELRTKLASGLEKGRKVREGKIVQKIKDAQRNHPQFATNAPVLSGLTGAGVKTIEKYMREGLV